MSTAEKVRRFRKRIGLTQAELGARLFLAQSTVSEIERGVQFLTIRNRFALEQIAREKNVPLSFTRKGRRTRCQTTTRRLKR